MFGHPLQPARDPQRSGYCNEKLPDTNVYARFIYFIRYLAANGFNIIIDNHFNVDTLAMDNPTQWVRHGSTHMQYMYSQRWGCTPPLVPQEALL